MEVNKENILAGQYLTFSLRDEEFAISISKVREVLDVSTMTKIPRMPDYLSGVINLRGNVVPVMDLGQKLDMGAIEKSINTSIIIVEVGDDDNSVVMGALTDAVQMVVDLEETDIESVPKMGTQLDIEFIKGMGRQEDKFLILLDIDNVLTSDKRQIELDMNLTSHTPELPQTSITEISLSP